MVEADRFVCCGGGMGMGIPRLEGGLYPIVSNEFLNDAFEDGHD